MKKIPFRFWGKFFGPEAPEVDKGEEEEIMKRKEGKKKRRKEMSKKCDINKKLL